MFLEIVIVVAVFAVLAVLAELPGGFEEPTAPVVSSYDLAEREFEFGLNTH